MQQAMNWDDLRWFGLPGMFMAGIVCDALLAALAYAQYGPGGPPAGRNEQAGLARPASDTVKHSEARPIAGNPFDAARI